MQLDCHDAKGNEKDNPAKNAKKYGLKISNDRHEYEQIHGVEQKK